MTLETIHHEENNLEKSQDPKVEAIWSLLRSEAHSDQTLHLQCWLTIEWVTNYRHFNVTEGHSTWQQKAVITFVVDTCTSRNS